MEISEHLEEIEATARDLAQKLNAASEAGVSPALILPRLVMVFRDVFGEVPPGILGMMGGMT